MYTLPDETRGDGSSGSARNREPSPFTGNDARALGSARRQANNTFTPNGGVNYANARRQGNDTFTPGGGINRANTMTATAASTAAAATRKTKAGNANADGDNPFRLPPLSSAEKAYMVRRAKESSIALVDHAHTLDGPVEWQYTGKFRGIQMYRGEGARSEADGMEYLCGVTTMMGTLAEVSAYFDQSTTARMRAKKADDVLDCAVLYALEQSSTTSRNPFYRVAVKYTSFEGPSTFSRARDYVYLECQDTFRHASGRRGWVLSMHSIKLPGCPEMDGTVRGSMYHSGYVFVEAERPGYMDVMHSLQINFRATKRLPSFMLHAALKRRITSVIKISREIQVARMGTHTLLRKQDLMPKSSRSVCANCARKFTLFIRKTRCRMCGQVVCQSCAPQVDWDVAASAASGGKRKTRICVQCYRTGGGLLVPTTTTSTSTTSSKHSNEYSDEEIDELADQHDHDDDDGANASDDGLEEQTEESMFAQSRFTRSAESLYSFSSDFHIHDATASGVSNSKTKANAKTTAQAIGWSDMAGTSYDQPPDVLHEDMTFDYADNLSASTANSAMFDATRVLTPEDTDESLDRRAQRYDPNFRSTTLADNSVPPPPPPPLSPRSQLSAGALKEHNQRIGSAKKLTAAPSQSTAPLPPAPTLLSHQSSAKLVSIRDIRSNFLKGSTKGELPTVVTTATTTGPIPAAAPSTLDDNDAYFSRPPSAILSKVRANRSRTIQFAPEGDYRSLEAMQSMQHEHARRMAELGSATATAAATATAYSTSLRVQEPERNSDDDTPFTLEQLEVPAKVAPVATGSSSGYDDNAAVMKASATDDMDADDCYAPVSALALSQVRATRSQTIEFLPYFLTDADDNDDEAAAQSQPQQHALSSPLTTRSSDEPRLTDQYANLQFPMGDDVEMATSSGVQPTGHDDNDTQRLRFSQTMIPILDFAASQRSSTGGDGNDDHASPTRLTLALAARESRKFSDIPLLGRSVGASSESSVRESDLDLELLGRSTTVIMDQVRAGRSHLTDYDVSDYDRTTEIMNDIADEHARRMAELNALALDYTGNRISRLHLVDEDRESLDTVAVDVDDNVDVTQQLSPLNEDAIANATTAANDECELFAASSVAVRAFETSESEPEDDDNDDTSSRGDNNGGVSDASDDGGASQRSTDFGAAHARVSSPRGAWPSSGHGTHNDCAERLTSLEFMPEDAELDALSPVAAPTLAPVLTPTLAPVLTPTLAPVLTPTLAPVLTPTPAPVLTPTPAPVLTPTPSRSTGLAFSLDLLEPRDAASTDEPTTPVDSPRASSVMDDEPFGRSTTVLFDQMRARRVPVATDLTLSDSELRSTAIMRDKEAAHRARMDELNAIALAHTGARASTFDVRESEDATGDRELLERVHTTHLDDDDDDNDGNGFRATAVLKRYQSAHDAKMQALRDKVRALDDACRASMASIFSADELDGLDLDVDESDDAVPAPPVATTAAAAAPTLREVQPKPNTKPKSKAAAARPKYRHRAVPPVVTSSRQDENSARIANLYSVAHLKPVAPRRAAVTMHERVSSATLYEQIAQLTQLQSQMALAKDADDEDAFKQRIKEQYQLLRTLKLRGY